MKKAAKLEFIGLGIGAKAPLILVPDSETLEMGKGYFVTTIPPSDVSMTDDFLAIDDLETFRRFAKKYGLEMFRGQLKHITGKRQQSLEETFTRIAILYLPRIYKSKFEIVSEVIWHALERYIRKTQKEVRSLMENKVSDPPAFYRQLQECLSAVRVRVSKHEKRDGYALFLSGRGIKEACFLQVALAGNEVSVCDRSPRCPNTFLKIQGKKYCSDTCLEAARKERRLEDPRENQRRALKERAARRRDKGTLAPVEEKECRREINAARTKTKLQEIEKRYGLQKQPAGRKRTL